MRTIWISAFGCLRDLFAGAAFFEGGRDVERVAFGGKDHGEEALSALPVDAGEIGERRALAEKDSGEVVVAHQLTGAILALGALFDSDGLGFGAA